MPTSFVPERDDEFGMMRGETAREQPRAQQRQAQASMGMFNQLSSALGGGVPVGTLTTNGTNEIHYWNGSTGTALEGDSDQEGFLPRQQWKQGSRDYGVVNFYRINEKRNDAMLQEPLDDLRIKVAKWLYN